MASRLASMKLEAAAKDFAGNWQKFESFGWHEKPADAENWGIYHLDHRDSNLLDQSNAAAITKELEVYGDDVVPQRFGHWAVGWIDALAVRVYKRGKITDAFQKLHELLKRLDDYPVLDDEDLSQRETETILDWIESEGGRLLADPAHAPEGWESEVYRVLEGDYSEDHLPNEMEILEAMEELGYEIDEDAAADAEARDARIRERDSRPLR